MEFLEHYFKLVIPGSLDGQFTYHYRDTPQGKTFIQHWWSDPKQQSLEPTPASHCKQQLCNQQLFNQQLFNQQLWAHALDETLTYLERAIALLCLRCCVSWYLRENVHYIVNKYGKIRPEEVTLSTVAAKLLTDADIHPIICLDQGQIFTLNLALNLASTPSDHPPQLRERGDHHFPLSFEILQTWNPSITQAKNLRSWVRRKSTNHNVLKWFGICTSTPWYLLSRVKQWQLHRLPQVSQLQVQTFKSIYLTDLHCQRTNKYQRFPAPTVPQLQQIQRALLAKGIEAQQTPDELRQTLTDIAEAIRDMDKHLSFKDTAVSHQQTEDLITPATENQICDIIEETFGGFEAIIQKATHNVLATYAQELAQKRQGAKKLTDFKRQGYLLYCQGFSQQEIAEMMAVSQSTISRSLNIKNCLKNTQIICVDLAQTAIMGDPFIDLDPDGAMYLTDYLSLLFSEDLQQAKRETSSASNQGDRWQSSYSLAAQQYFQSLKDE